MILLMIAGAFAYAWWNAARAASEHAERVTVVERDGATVAFTVDAEGGVQQRTLEMGESIGQQREVRSGLSAGDEVVLDPPSGLADGDRVQVLQ